MSPRMLVEEEAKPATCRRRKRVEQFFSSLLVGNGCDGHKAYHPEKSILHDRSTIFGLTVDEVFTTVPSFPVSPRRPPVCVHGGRGYIKIRRDSLRHELGIRPERDSMSSVGRERDIRSSFCVQFVPR